MPVELHAANVAAAARATKQISLGGTCVRMRDGRVRWIDLPVHVIDFEGSSRTGVVEFGVVTLRGGAIERVETRLCRPRRPMLPHEINVHGLRDETLAAAEPFEAEWLLFSGLRETGVLAAHFSATENALLRATWPCPRLSPDFLEPGREMAEWGPWLDTGRLIGELRPGAASAALESVIAHLGLTAELNAAAAQWCPAARRRFHCAPFDALATAFVLLALGLSEDGAASTLTHLLALSTADARARDERRQARLF
ncbi:MAG: 3'-5' exonuclease [Opitutaceae bacterium]